MEVQEIVEKSNGLAKKNKDIRTISDLWEAAIAYKQEGQYDTDAMYFISRDMNPKLTFQDIANVFSGVYADTYWDVVKMDPAILSKSMVQALGVSRSNADDYAKKAMTQWRGILSRNDIHDTGRIPTTSSYSQSIDIVCNENTPLQPVQLIENWNNQFWKSPIVGKNYIYVRVQNRDFVGDLLPKAQMFYTTGGFNQPPSSWIQCYTAEGNEQEGEILLIDNTPGPLQRGDRGASEAFMFEPKSSDHVCIIAAIKTEFFEKNDPLKISNNWDSTTWITHNGAAVWHNVNPQTQVESHLKIYNQDGSKEKFVFTAQCRNVPIGSVISFENKENNFSSGDIAILNPNQSVQLEAELSGYYEGDLKLSIEGPDGKLLPTNAAIEFNMLWKLEKGHEFYSKAAERFNEEIASSNGQSILTPLGSYTIIGEEK